MSDSPISRRRALNRLWQLSGLTALGACGLIGLRFMGSRAPDSLFGGVIEAGKPKEFPPGSVTAFDSARFYLVRAEDGGFLALYHRCTHLDCVILWRDEAAEFFCPCHGSVFATDGDVRKEPAPEPLVRFPVTFDERGRVRVDTGSPIRRRQVSPDDFVYAPADAPETPEGSPEESS